VFDPYANIELSVAQITEALGDTNRYYCSQKLQREPSMRELIIHYIDNTPPYTVHTIAIDDPDCEQILFV